MSRYETRKVRVLHPWVDDGDVRTMHVVWDLREDRWVDDGDVQTMHVVWGLREDWSAPFGGFGKRDRAESSIRRMKER